jgi:two-component system cell cycle response regulator DivK
MAPNAGLPQCHVLLTDDDPLVRTVYADTLRARGCEVTEARNGGECVSLAASLQPDLVLLDLSMPGMDGWQALAALRADPLTRTIPVIALTATATTDVRTRAAEAGFDAFVPKPFTPKGLLRDLDAAWARIQARRPAPPSEPPLATLAPVPAI